MNYISKVWDEEMQEKPEDIENWNILDLIIYTLLFYISINYSFCCSKSLELLHFGNEKFKVDHLIFNYCFLT